jgi:outer membrane protein OmpA-like peptidoglycan-associated protein
VPFDNGSAELTPQAIAALDELGKALSSSALASYKFRIEGHTDTVGSKEYNLSLSDRRAAAVSAYLEQKFGVNQSRLETVGVGEAHLLVPTPDQTPEPRNRRVTVVNLGA